VKTEKKKLIRRRLQSALSRELDTDIVSAVIGPRQAGKTTLLNQQMEELLLSGVPEQNVLFFNFDDLNLRSSLSEDPAQLAHLIEIRLGQPLVTLGSRAYVFLDEAQKVPGLFDTIKLLFDKYKAKVKLLVSGSSSLQMQKHSAETLAGRLRYHYLFPLTLREIVTHHGLWDDSSSPLELIMQGSVDTDELLNIQSTLWQAREIISGLKERMRLYGSLPGIYTESSEEERWFMLRDYAATYIEKDVRLLGGVGNLDLFHRLYRALALQHGQILNVSNLATDLGAKRDTISSYLNALVQTFVLHRVPHYSRRPKIRLMKSPKMYLFDSGLANHETRQTSLEALRASGRLGALEEGILLSHMLSISRNMPIPPEVSFIRDYTGHEVDFAIESDITVGFEVTTEERLRKKRYRNIGYIARNLGLNDIVITGRFPELKTEKIADTRLTLLPSWMAW
jgi:predicted AAA+ superfamily ATPase